MSLWQIAQAVVLIITSPGPGAASSIVSIVSGAPNARQTAALAVVFGGKEDLAPEDVAAAEQHGWPVAGPDAYPSVYRMEPGLSLRPPLAWEVGLLEGALRAVPEFARKKTRRLAPLSLTVPTAGGELPLVLAWAV